MQWTDTKWQSGLEDWWYSQGFEDNALFSRVMVVPTMAMSFRSMSSAAQELMFGLPPCKHLAILPAFSKCVLKGAADVNCTKAWVQIGERSTAQTLFVYQKNKDAMNTHGECNRM